MSMPTDHKDRTDLSISFRAMADADLDRVLQIEKDSFSHPWSRRQFRDELGRGAFSLCLVAVARSGSAPEVKEDVCGYVLAWLVADELHVTNLAVDPHLRGRRVARRMMEELISTAVLRGALWCGLEVRVSNLSAIALYRGMGFAVSGRRRRYYSNGEDALVMERSLGGEEGGGR